MTKDCLTALTQIDRHHNGQFNVTILSLKYQISKRARSSVLCRFGYCIYTDYVTATNGDLRVEDGRIQPWYVNT